jgi:CheY-like chemotaxis protein
MAKTTSPNTIVVVDDEIHNITWLLDYLEANGFKTITASNVNEALEVISKEIYRALIIDLNIPVLDPLHQAVTERGGSYAKFPGLYVADRARNQGYRDRQVVIYSVHKDAGVAEEVLKLGCTYILKGRPAMIRDEIQYIVSFDPTAEE